LDESFGLSVRAWSIGPGALGCDRSSLAEFEEYVRAVGAAVVRKHPLDLDSMPPKEDERTSQETRRGVPLFVGEDLCVGQAREVVDGYVDVLPACSTRAV